MTAILGTAFFIFRSKRNFFIEEIVGYITIVLSLLFVYVAIRQWREQYNYGALTFGQGLKIGTLVTLFPSFLFGLYSWIEMSILDPGFGDKYYNYTIENIKKTTPPGELQAALQSAAYQKEIFSNPFMQFIAMFGTVFIIGFIITIISAMILRRKQPKVSRA
jgi:hypothetical protein